MTITSTSELITDQEALSYTNTTSYSDEVKQEMIFFSLGGIWELELIKLGWRFGLASGH